MKKDLNMRDIFEGFAFYILTTFFWESGHHARVMGIIVFILFIIAKRQMLPIIK